MRRGNIWDEIQEDKGKEESEMSHDARVINCSYNIRR